MVPSTGAEPWKPGRLKRVTRRRSAKRGTTASKAARSVSSEWRMTRSGPCPVRTAVSFPPAATRCSMDSLRGSSLRCGASAGEIDLADARIGHHLGPGAFAQDPALVHDRDGLGERERDVHVVLDEHDGDVARDRADERLNVPALLARQPGERLVEEPQPRRLGER